MIVPGAMPALLPAQTGVSQTSQITIQSGLCRHPGRIALYDSVSTPIRARNMTRCPCPDQEIRLWVVYTECPT
jgi:hypothetical protein